MQKLIALILLILISPILIIASMVSFLATWKSPIIIQNRALSLKQKRFRLIKIRTISEIKNQTLNEDILNKKENNYKITKYCKYLRLTGIDELPQLINIIKGEMNFIGPRPLLINELEQMKKETPKLYKTRETIKIKPGLTGFWQVYGDRNFGTENLITCDKYYELNKSFLLNAKIIFKSIIILLEANHKDAIISNEERKKATLKLTELKFD